MGPFQKATFRGKSVVWGPYDQIDDKDAATSSFDVKHVFKKDVFCLLHLDCYPENMSSLSQWTLKKKVWTLFSLLNM